MNSTPPAPSRSIQESKILSTRQRLGLVLLFAAPAILVLGKLPGSPAADFLMRCLSLHGMPPELEDRVYYVLFVPLGALMVVFFRLSLGIRLLGPFRSILIAVAFQITGILAGLVFLVAIIGLMAAFRPFVKALRLPYFARVSVMLSAVSLLIILAIYACEWADIAQMERVAYFPIVVICLTAEGFARTLSREGFRSALWRAGMTALVAVLITLAASISELKLLLASYPELLLAQVGGIIVIAHYFDWRLFQAVNPTPRKKKRAGKSKPVQRESSKSTRAEPPETTGG